MLKQLFHSHKPLVGMIHLPPLPGYSKHPGMAAVIRKALADLETLETAGFNGALVENDNDQPHQIGVVATVAEAFQEVMQQLLHQATIPVGMEIIYDMPATVEVASAVQAPFVRLDVFADSVKTRWGVIPAQAAEIMRLKHNLDAEGLIVLADVHVKHAQLLGSRSLCQSTAETVAQGADGLIVTGDWTGFPPTIEDCRAVKAASAGRPVWVGSGLSPVNAPVLLAHADGAIVGSSIKTGELIDLQKAAQLVRVASSLRKV